ncbi:alpha/beta hydrolase [Nonomuraea longicatena]|uniref:BD-FAE-like domain-containing protein n=1 Tax=Nonomuraea longicatena TaxID=83682 RepID=A0ABN1P887_9ACTN
MDITIVPYDGTPRRLFHLLHPEDARAPYAVCFVHGGGWRAGEPAQWHGQMRAAAGRGVVSASLGYRVGGRLNEMMADVACGFRLFTGHLAARGHGGLPVFLIGSSAGAHLATLLTLTGPDPWLDPGSTPAHPESGRPAGCVSLNGPGTLVPWPGMDPEIRAAVDHLAGATGADDTAAGRQGGDGGPPTGYAAASPETWITEAPVPPFLFVVVGKERFFPHRHVRDLAARLPEADVLLLPGAEHGFFYRVGTPDSGLAQAAVDAFIRRHV